MKNVLKLMTSCKMLLICFIISQILSKNGAPIKNIQQQQSRASDPFPIIVRQLQTSGTQKAAGKPPPIYSNPTLWFAAILFGGGAYVIYENFKGKGDGVFQDGSLYPKKRKFYLNFYFYFEFKKRPDFN